MKHKQCSIKGFEKLYYIYENGDIYSVRKKRLLKHQPNGVYRYMYVCLTGRNKQQLRTGVHRLVAHHWINPQPERHPVLGKYEINHIDGNTLNNHYSNLEWITHSENMRKAVDLNGRWLIGRPKGLPHKQSTKQLMSEAKMISTILKKGGIEVNCASIQDAADYINVSRRTIERNKNSYKTVKGFSIRTLS